MNHDFGSANPYLSPLGAVAPPPQRESAPGSLLAPAMALIAVGVLGLAFAIFNFAMSFGEAHIEPGAPQFVREVQQNSVGPVATGIQGTFALLNLFIIMSGVQMMRLQNWGMAVAGSALAMVNIGSCCCVIGLPVGLWSLMVLMNSDIISTFSAAQAQQ